MLGSGFSFKCSDLEAVTSPLKLLVTGYSENFECNREKHMQHIVILCKQGRGFSVVVPCDLFFQNKEPKASL